MTGIIITCKVAELNLTPTLFRNSARELLKVCIEMENPSEKLSVSFFLCCRSVELALKAQHSERGATRKAIKDEFGHKLLKSYNRLNAEQKTLSQEEITLLTKADNIYSSKEFSNKGFEYLSVWHAGTAFKDFPDLNQLITLARKIVNNEALL